jgi:hypothetical protein
MPSRTRFLLPLGRSSLTRTAALLTLGINRRVAIPQAFISYQVYQVKYWQAIYQQGVKPIVRLMGTASAFPDDRRVAHVICIELLIYFKRDHENDIRAVVITGASSGIGFALAQSFLNRGYKVVGNARTIEQ